MTMVSLLLCLAAAALWHRSNRVADVLTFGTRQTPGPDGRVSQRDVLVTWRHGEIYAGWSSRTWDPNLWTFDDPAGFGWTAEPAGGRIAFRNESFTRRLGFAAAGYTRHDSASYNVDSRGLFFPFWVVMLATGLLPMRWVLAFLTVGARARRGACPNCGYDLRASRDRCPECGTLAK
jgi:hypothetical protein